MFDLQIGSEPWLRAASIYLRMQVFVLDRGIAAKDEFDQNDIPGVVYAVIFDGQEPVATGRFLREDDGSARLTRIATRIDYRGQHLGTQIIKALERQAQDLHIHDVQIHAEVTAIPFYAGLGYRAVSAVYLEDGVPCRVMARQL